MKIIIDIPDEDYNVILENANFYIAKHWGLPTVWSAIASGTPLPKGHEDLIDRDELKISYETSLKQALRNNDKGIDLSKAADIPCERFNQFIDKVPTVVPADNSEVD